MVIVCAVSDGYYLPAPLTLLYVSRLLSPTRPSFSLFFSLLFTPYLSRPYYLSPLLRYAASTSTLSPSLLLITQQYLFFHFSCLSSQRSRILSFVLCYLSFAFMAAQMQVQQFNL